MSDSSRRSARPAAAALLRAVQVPDLMPVYPKLDPTEPVNPRLDLRPPLYLTLDGLPDTGHVALLSYRLYLAG